MWRNRFGVLLILTFAVTSLPGVTYSQGDAANATPTQADSGTPFRLMQINFDFGPTKISTIVRIDERTGQAWTLAQRTTPAGQTYLGWTDVVEGGTKPKP